MLIAGRLPILPGLTPMQTMIRAVIAFLDHFRTA
jgi:hypothetical protein